MAGPRSVDDDRLKPLATTTDENIAWTRATSYADLEPDFVRRRYVNYLGGRRG